MSDILTFKPKTKHKPESKHGVDFKANLVWVPVFSMRTVQILYAMTQEDFFKATREPA